MADLLEVQKQLLRSLNRSLENFKKIGRSNYTSAKIRNRLSALKETWNQIRTTHFNLLKEISSTDQASIAYEKENLFDLAEDTYQVTSDYMADRLDELEPTVSQPQSFHNSTRIGATASISLNHLPPIKLPPFDGRYEEWESFRDRFTSLIINNCELTNFSRMHFLVSSLKDRALDCVKTLPVTEENFGVAWNLFKSRFENKRRLINVHLTTLLTLTGIRRESVADLQSLRDKVRTTIASLHNLDRSADELWNDIIVCLVSQKLDAVTRKAWNLKFCDDNSLPTLDDLTKFLDYRIRALEEWKSPSPSSEKAHKSSVKVNAATALTKTVIKCSLCQDCHKFQSCPRFMDKSPSQRRDLVKKENRCFNCLSSRHLFQACPSQFICRHCRKKHHTLLHESPDASINVEPVTSQQQTSKPADEQSIAVNSLLTSAHKHSRSQILLATAWISVASSSGRSICVRALLDQGSERTFITERLAQLLRLKRIHMPSTISAVGGVCAGTARHAALISVSPRNRSTPAVSTSAIILNKLTAYSPPRVSSDVHLARFSALKWADKTPMSSHPIDVLIGADIYGDVILDGLSKFKAGMPVAQNSIFSWIISGPVASSTMPAQSSLVASNHARCDISVVSHHVSHSPLLDQELRQFWELEEVPHTPILSPEDKRCEEHFCLTHSRAPDGRYIVRLPFKHGPPIDIGESRLTAEKILHSLIRRLNSNPDMSREYGEFMAEYERLGHMVEVPPLTPPDEQSVVIPHHPVVRESSSTTRLRVVFNAASLTSNGSSLNDHLLAGPKLQTELPAVLLQWRQFRFVYSADIAKMYRQIRVDPRDCNYQRILWSPSSMSPHRTYQLQTVTYGTASAPFLALRVLKQLTLDDGPDFPRAVPILQRHIYVDDVLFGDDDQAVLRQIRDELNSLLYRGGFELRKWASNSSDLLTDIAPENHGLACEKTLHTDEILKVLGITWNPSRDVFKVQVSLSRDTPRSKRLILSTIAKLFDPLGWVTPAIVMAKIFLQSLWRLKISWDDPLQSDDLEAWNRVYSDLPALNSVQIPRWTRQGTEIVRLEMHGFADASSVAYAAVVYLKVISRSGEITISLLAGRSKVAPIKSLSIPRLELSAAVLLARLMRFVRQSIAVPDSDCYCWSDSTIVLAWLKQDASRWKTFVANRVAVIQSALANVPWRHVPTSDNPADCASRGLLASDLCKREIWWNGPKWLVLSSEHWPNQHIVPHADDMIEARATTVHVAHTVLDWDLASKFSSWPKLLRVTAYLFKFLRRCRDVSRTRVKGEMSASLSVDDCRRARLFWLKAIQSKLFFAEITALKRNQPVSSRSAAASLSPFLDDDGLLHVGGRLKHAPMPFRRKFPILLAADPLVDLIIKQAHLRSLHAGLQLTLTTVRQDFWILRGRTIVKAMIHRCVVCARERAAIPSQIMGDLPRCRVSRSARCFSHCGIDYVGPVLVRASSGRGITTRKAYIALFICLSTRAIHLELVGGYSTAAFLDAYARFCARRGLPDSMYSDNGTTFVGTDKELSAAYRSALTDENFKNKTALDNTSWHFIPPSAPHFGGLWEAGVRSVKHHLRRLLKTNTLTFEEFSTLLCRIEACLNSRPIAPLKDTLDCYDALTPGHFLVGAPLTLSPEPSVLDLNESRLSRWQRTLQITERFWKLWQNDYINTLQQRNKWKQRKPNIPR